MYVYIDRYQCICMCIYMCVLTWRDPVLHEAPKMITEAAVSDLSVEGGR